MLCGESHPKISWGARGFSGAGPEQEVPLPEYPAAQTQAGAAAGESCTQLGGVKPSADARPAPALAPVPPPTAHLLQAELTHLALGSHFVGQ